MKILLNYKHQPNLKPKFKIIKKTETHFLNQNSCRNNCFCRDGRGVRSGQPLLFLVCLKAAQLTLAWCLSFGWRCGGDQKSAYSQAPCSASLTLRLSHSWLTLPSSSLTTRWRSLALGSQGSSEISKLSVQSLASSSAEHARFLSHFTSGVIYFCQLCTSRHEPSCLLSIYTMERTWCQAS